ncbi:oligosaccharide flippase family protein [Fervidibacillus halotolerans]|uniref:Oligosaccharide flippase family protein n=1 Tax=Fervidibacillus halotolerans TaxID=2980027 RepID=A0A9E8RXH0_9BACI|nr:oligosaccharide flippase family protein [Fervidibacillus halotolerans]WAA12765.1 oligosaccharide flippase family protein [Fervidibacillus halotolerans]
MGLFIKGVFVLASTAFIGECIEFLINLVLARELGEYGLGQYMTILPFVALIMILSSMELPISISKFIAERERKFHLPLLKLAVKLVVILIIILSILSFFLFTIFDVFTSIHPFANWVVIILIPIVSLSSIARGYFLGVQRMGKIAVANLFRRGLQLFFLVLIFSQLDLSIDQSVLIAICSIVVGELFEFLFLFSAYFFQIRDLKKEIPGKLPKTVLAKSLLTVSLPTTGMRIFHAFSHAVQPILIKFSLVTGGLSFSSATEHFGRLAGVAFPIGFFPAFMAHSIMTALIPSVSKAYAKKDQVQLLMLLKNVIKLTAAYGIPVCIGLYAFPETFTKLFVESKEAADYLRLLWPYFFLHYFSIPLQGFLIGLGLLKDALFHHIWSTCITFFLMYFLGSNPLFLMDGIIIGMNTGAVLLMALHYFTICKKIGVSFTLTRQHPLLSHTRK